MSIGYLLSCMWHKLLHKKRVFVLIFFSMMIAAFGTITVASVARNRELQTPWYAQRSAKITFEQPASPLQVYNVLNKEYDAGTVNGYALIANVDTSGGVALGGLEGALWYPVTSDDQRYSTRENLFWIHQQAVPEKFFHNLKGLTASINGFDLRCAGLTRYGLNWQWSDGQVQSIVPFLIDGKPAHVESPVLEHVYMDDEWFYIAPIIVGARWIAENNIPVMGVCITLVNPNDQTTLNRIISQISASCVMTTEWSMGRTGSLTANEWIYLGALILAMLNVASLYYGLIDSYGAEFFIFRKIGAPKGSICKAVLILIALMSVCAFVGAWFIYVVLLNVQGGRQWLAVLPVCYTIGLFLGYVGICALLALQHTKGSLKSFRKKGTNL